MQKIVMGKSAETEKIVNTDLLIEFKNEEIYQKLLKETSQCVICYDFYFKGELKKSGQKGYFFVADSVKYELRNNTCCQ
ncbi:hypothetical protein ACFFLS_00820 [Flavobacterium procerum]|uniref:Uncharacterized protein n=1 Tax=Flavobacterium procerum TaxID=1455569 RepID=A0ABV6BLP1_9FLAO